MYEVIGVKSEELFLVAVEPNNSHASSKVTLELSAYKAIGNRKSM